MSLEWARARLLQHCEELRKLCEARVAVARAQERAALAAERPAATAIGLRPAGSGRVAPDSAETGIVLRFVQPRRRA